MTALKVRDNSVYSRKFPTELKEWKRRIEAAARQMGLEVPEVIYEVVTTDEMAGLAAYTGLPSRYQHWSFGMEYEQMRRQNDYHAGGIMEMVCTARPFVAYLRDANSLATQKSVMAHVVGHAVFLANNFWTKHIYDFWIDEFASHGARIEKYINRHGLETVEKFLDACLSAETLVDIDSVFMCRRPKPDPHAEPPDEQPGRLKTPEYLDSYVNQPEWLEKQRAALEKERKERNRLLLCPEKDILLFLIEHAPIEAWQRDILSIVREERYYFVPLGRTKTADEGFATRIQHLLMTGSDATNPYHERIYLSGGVPAPILEPNELVHYSDEMARIVFNYGYNPYLVGRKIFESIEERWNRGQFGSEWEECRERETLRKWDKKLGLGRQKMLEVAFMCNDISFIDNYLTQEIVDELKIFVWRRDGDDIKIKTRDLEAVKRALLRQMTNSGYPTVEAVEVDNQGNLKLRHKFDGVKLDEKRTREVLQRIAVHIWKKDVMLETITGEKSDTKSTWLSRSGIGFPVTCAGLPLRRNLAFPRHRWMC